MRIRGLSILLTIAAAAFGAGCSSTQDDTEVGSLRMPLRATAPSGNTYQLNAANFDVSDMGGTVAMLSSDTDPAATVISADLPVGSYQINLISGWNMLNVTTGNPVSATLLSPTSQAFDITDGATTNVAYRFRINGEIVVVGGTLEVVLDITEATSCGSDPQADALAACTAQFGANCFDTGTASYIGFAEGHSQAENCTTDTTIWAQFCYADAEDVFNCNTCQVGAIKAAHDPCMCGDNTATVGNFCEGGTGGESVTYSEAFEQGITPVAQCDAWNMFRGSIVAGATYNSITLRNTDGSSASCTGAVASELCLSLSTGAPVAATACDGRVWATGDCGGNLELSANGDICSCTDGFVVRPCIGNLNWGGAGTPTCDGPSQTLEVICE